jgi:phosphoribosylaminoimidazole-succinocarboxamide synthase
MGSVKDLSIIQPAQPVQPGVGQFKFSDRYSVFDWGEMPDLIKNKGKALCLLGAYFFESLNDLGISTHYQGLVEGSHIKELSDLTEPVDTMQVSLVRVIHPEEREGNYDYAEYNENLTNCLIPLEIIYRNSLPEGSSIFRRLKSGNLKLEEIGLTSMPQPNDILKEPILDASTKLETTDRYLSWTQAQKMARLTDEEVTDIKRITHLINNFISKHVDNVGLSNEDGKVEYAFNEKRNIMLVDVLGTPDECRFTHSGFPVSKELARIYYRNTEWYEETEQAKKKDRSNWKKLVSNDPPNLSVRFLELISQLYQSCCNEITQREWFKTPPLKNILIEIQDQISL